MPVDKTLNIKFRNLSRFKANLDTEINGKLSAKVDKVTGKGLSTNDFTDANVTTLASAIQSISVSGESLVTKTGTSAVLDLSGFAKKTDISSAYRYKGSVATYANLPSTDLTAGDVYNIETADSTHNINAGDNVAWNGTDWDNLAGVVDLSGYVEKVTGKGLSSNDFTDALKTKLESIEYATDADIDSLFSTGE